MAQEMNKSKWKPWHKKGIAIMLAILFFLAYIGTSVDNKEVANNTPDPVGIRQKKIETAFSEWDGSHRKLTTLVKKNMNDPESFEYVDGQYWDRDSFLVVSMRYRGKNAFGGKVMESVKAKCSIDGDVIEIIQ